MNRTSWKQLSKTQNECSVTMEKMKNTTRSSVLAASAIAWSCWASGCSTSLSNNRALFRPTEKPAYVEGRSEEIKNLYWAHSNNNRKYADPQLKRNLAE